jgi:hypothetical protein
MITKSKSIIVAAVLTAGIVSPSFAQEPDHTGSQMPYYYDSNGGQVRGSWGPQDAASSGRPAARSHAVYGDVPSRHSRRVQ